MDLVYYLISEYLWFIGLLVLFFVGYLGISKRQRHQIKASIKYQDNVSKMLHVPTTLHPAIDPERCGGCGACVTACPEGEILKLINHRAVLVEATKCVGHGVCAEVCPFDAISLVFGTKTRGMELPKLDTNYQTNVKGLYIAGELGGMGLIRNAVKQGKLAAEHACKTIKSNQKTDVEVLIVGAGPAGLSAAMSCHSAKVKYLCVEQNKFGGTIYNFPRQKIVMTQPIEFPKIGKVTFSQNKISKEDILDVWNKIRRLMKLRISENAKFINLEKKGDIFIATTSKGTITAKKVVLCLGVRGSPRKLGIPGEHLSKVTYNLLDPEQYQGQHIAIVGAGNAAAEAAQMLANPKLQNKVHLLVRGASLNRCNEENQRIIFEMEKRGLLKILYHTKAKEVLDKRLILDSQSKPIKIKNDYLFIFAGAELPFKFLKDLGIKIGISYGDPLQAG
jgi:thioredoxin reductase (NADPH)